MIMVMRQEPQRLEMNLVVFVYIGMIYVFCGFGLAAKLRDCKPLPGFVLIAAFLFWPIFALFMEW